MWLLVQVCDPSIGGARRSFATVRLRLPRSRISGFARRGSPRSDLAWHWIGGANKVKMAFRCFAAETFVLGITPTGAVSGDFPAVMGISSIEGLKTKIGSGASPSRPGCRRSWSSAGLLCNFGFVLGFSVSSEYQ
jgi:hypothetical protein